MSNYFGKAQSCYPSFASIGHFIDGIILLHLQEFLSACFPYVGFFYLNLDMITKFK